MLANWKTLEKMCHKAEAGAGFEKDANNFQVSLLTRNSTTRALLEKKAQCLLCEN